MDGKDRYKIGKENKEIKDSLFDRNVFR